MKRKFSFESKTSSLSMVHLVFQLIFLAIQSSNICSYLGQIWPQAQKNKTNLAWKKILIFQEMELSCPKKKLNKIFYPLNKTSLGEAGCLGNFYYLLTAKTSRIHFQNCSLEKYILKMVFSKNINFISLSVSLITFFSIYWHFFKKHLGIIISIFPESRKKLIIAKQVWLKSNLGKFLS